MTNRIMNGVRMFGVYRMGAILILCGFSVCAMGVCNWCYYTCAQNGVKQTDPVDVCHQVGEDPCVGTCTKYTYTANVTCYDCDTTSSTSTCRPGGYIPAVPASYYVTSCGQGSSSCICLEPWILRDNNTSFPCYTTVSSGDSACVVW